MPRVHFVKAARKDNSVVAKGESYYWWKFMRGGKYRSKNPPKRSQLTRSDYLIQIYELFDSLDGRFGEVATPDFSDVTSAEEAQELVDGWPSDFEGVRDEVAEEIRAIGEDCQEKLDNMEAGGFSGGNSWEILEERVETCEAMADEAEGIELDVSMICVEDSYWDEDDETLDSASLESDLQEELNSAVSDISGTEQ